MAVVGSLIVLLGANNAALTAGLLKAEGELKAFGATAGTTSAMTGAILGGIGLVAAAGIGLAVNAAKSFQEEMAKVNTIAHLAPEPLAALGQEVRNLSVTSGVGVGDLTSGLYDLFSVGVPAGQAMEFLTNATTLSIGGLSTANEAVLGITTAINAWSGASGDANLTMNDSAKVMDIFAQAIAAGGMTAADIPAALANVASQAARMNMPLEEVGATWAILTTRGETADSAMTSLSATLTALAKAPPGMEKLQKAFGKTYLEIAQTKGVHEAVMQVVEDTEKLGLTFDEVWGRKEASAFVGFTTGPTGDALWTEALANAPGVGEAVRQMAERMGTLDAQLRILGASANELGIQLGTALLPPLTTLVQTVSGAVQGVTSWAAANPALSSSLLPVIAGVALLGVGVAVLGAPFVALIAIITLVMLNLDALGRGIQVVIDTITRMIELAKIGADTVANIPGVGPAADAIGYGGQVAGAAARTMGGNFGPSVEAATFMAQFEAQNGRRATPLDWQRFQAGGGQQPIQINSTTNLKIDGDTVAALIERRVWSNAGIYNSGFSSDDSSHHQ